MVDPTMSGVTQHVKVCVRWLCAGACVFAVEHDVDVYVQFVSNDGTAPVPSSEQDA